MKEEITIHRIKEDTEKAVHIMSCIAAGILSNRPDMIPQELVDQLFIAVVKLHLGMDEAFRDGNSENEMMCIRPTHKEIPDDIIIQTVDDDFTTEIRQAIGAAATLAFRDKRVSEERSQN